MPSEALSRTLDTNATGSRSLPVQEEGEVTRKKGARWQWLHRTGFKDYDEDESQRIEAAFKKGDWMVRMKLGSGQQAKPRQIFFYDMVQVDPNGEPGKNTREVQRVPPISKAQWLSRRIAGMVTRFARGDIGWWKPLSMEDFQSSQASTKNAVDPRMFLDIYAERPFWFTIIESWWFGSLSMFMIFCNSVYLWVDADYNPGSTIFDTIWVFIMFDNIFCAWFFFELIFRFMAFRWWRSAFKDRWFIIDFCLVFLMVMETWVLQIIVALLGGESSAELKNLSVFRTVRLFRLGRITRLFRIFPQLFVLIKGMFLAMSSLIYTLMLLFVLTFTFAVIFKYMSEFSEDLQALYYNSVGGGFWNLMIYGTFVDSLIDHSDALKEAGIGYAFVFYIYIFISNLTMLNMLIGVLCEVIANVTTDEQAEIEQNELSQQLVELLECYDNEGDHSLSQPEYQSLMQNPDLKIILDQYQIDIDDLDKMQYVLFTQKIAEGETAQSSKVSYETFVDKVLQLRGGNAATVTDMVELRNWLTRKLTELTQLARGESIEEDGGEGEEAEETALEPLKNEQATQQEPKPKDDVIESMLPGQVPGNDKNDLLIVPIARSFEEEVLEQLAAIVAHQQSVTGDLARMRGQIYDLQKNTVMLPAD